MNEKTEHEGGCHCGAVRFRVELDAEPRVRRCNCSICTMKGVAMLDVPLHALIILQGEDQLSRYSFNTGEAKHHFCSICGIHTFHQTRSDPDKYGINAACVDGMTPYDWAEVPVFDGRNHPKDTGDAGGVVGIMRYERLID